MQKTSKRVLALILAMIMLLSICTVAVSAYEVTYQSTTHTVFRHTESTLAPGIVQDICYSYLNDGDQNVYYVVTADISRDDVLVQGSYKDAQVGDWGMQRLTEQMAAANAKYSDPDNEDFISEYYAVVAGTNGDFYDTTSGRPSGAFFINGHKGNSANNRPWFAIKTDGTAAIGYGNADWPGDENVKEAVGGSMVVVWDGEDVTAKANGSYDTDRHCRTAIGIKADGSVVSMVLDGRQPPFSTGGSMHEVAQIMLEAGCVYAINLDGGGSTTYAARQPGSDTIEVINRPSDNSERSISSGVIIASLTPPSDVFDRATLTPTNDYVTPGTSIEVAVTGVSPAGTAAEVPADVTYNVTGGSFDGTTFVSDGTVGDATITAMYDGNAVGSATIHVVVPDAIQFAQATITVPLGKTVDLGLSATYGVYDVTSKPSDYTITNDIGTVDGFSITAPLDAAVLTGTITATLNADNSKTASSVLNFGKASEVLYDFEDQTIDLKWESISDSNYNVNLDSYYVTAETGRVHSGNGAYAFHTDYSQDNEWRWSSCGPRNTGEDIVIPADAKAIGFWYYVPKEAVGCELDFRPYAQQANGSWKRPYLVDYEYGWSSTLEEDGWHYFNFDVSNYGTIVIPGAADKTAYPNLDSSVVFMQLYIDLGEDNDKYDYYFKDYANVSGDFVFYIDDITVDYSSAVDDREEPVFGNFTYAAGNMSDAAVIAKDAVPTATNNAIDFSARVAENTAKSNYTGIDAASAKAYIDGVEVAAKYQNGSISTASSATLADGIHTVKFAICDKQGNYASIIRQINVNAGSDIDTVKVVLNAGDDTYVKLGQLCSIDLVATDITKVQSVTAQFQLNTKTTWELDHITVADGFTADYSVRADNNVATVTVTRTGDVAGRRGANEAVLASLPIRAWTTNIESVLKSKQSFSKTDVSFDTVYGLMETTDGDDVSFSAARQAKDTEVYAAYADMPAEDRTKAWHNHDHNYNQSVGIVINDGGDNQTPDLSFSGDIGYYYDSESQTYKTFNAGTDNNTLTFTKPGFFGDNVKVHYWYEDGTATEWPGVDMTYIGENDYHEKQYAFVMPALDAVVPVEDLAPTCTEEGFTGRTYCKVCGSVVDWGAVVPANGHSYAVDPEDGLLKCETCGELFTGEHDGKQYVDGAVLEGFVDDKYYIDGVAQDYDGAVKIDGVYYEFDNGTVIGRYSGLYSEDGKLYYVQLGEPATGWKDIDDNYYYFEESTKAAYADTTVAIGAADEFYTFDENGVLIAGSFAERDGHTIYHWAGSPVKRRFFDIDGDTYYFDFRGWMVTGFVGIEKGSFAHENNYFVFTEDGKMVKQPGLTFACDGTICYLGDDYTAQYTGMIKEGDDYYYINSSLKAIKDCEYLCLKTNGLMPADKYAFGADGKLIPASVKNGIVEEDGALYYYVDGVKTGGIGAIEIDGDIYYVRSNAQLATGFYLVWTGNDLVPDMTWHTFDDDGKMNDPVEEPKNGVVEENGVLYLYIDGEKLVNAHIVEYDGALYYVRSSGALATGDYLVWEGNGYVPDMTIHHFDADGKLDDPEPPVVEVKNGIYEEDGSLYLYIDDVKQIGSGLVEYNNDLYYVRSAGQLATGFYLVWTGNGLLPDMTWHTFGEDGKLQADPEPEIKEGVYEENGYLYLYIDGEKLINAHIVEYDNALYYVRSGGQLAVGDYLVWTGNGYVDDMTVHHFDDDGKLNDPVE